MKLVREQTSGGAAAARICASCAFAGPAAATDSKEEPMDRLDLPKHILEKVERRWAQKLEQQALAWKDTRSDTRTATATGVQVVRRTKRTRRPVLRKAMG